MKQSHPGPVKRILLRLPVDLAAAIEQQARAEDVSVNAVLVRTLGAAPEVLGALKYLTAYTLMCDPEGPEWIDGVRIRARETGVALVRAKAAIRKAEGGN